MELLDKYGYSLVFTAMLLEQLGLPIPSAPVLILAGALAAGGVLSTPLVIFVSILGCIAGDIVWYEIGKRKGRSVLRTLCRVSLSPESCVRKMEASFAKYGKNSLLFAKFIPGLNTIAPPMAGMFHVRFAPFFFLNLAGSLLYCLSLFLPGFFFEKTVFEVTTLLEELGRSLLWIIIGGLAAYAVVKFIRLKLLQRLLYKERITPEELFSRISTGEQFMLVDLRSSVDPENTILPGAIRILPDEIDQHLSRLDRERWIVMYCT